MFSKRKSKLQLAVEEEIITPLRKRRSYNRKISRLCSGGKFYRRYKIISTDPNYLCTGCIFIDSVTLECKHPRLGCRGEKIIFKSYEFKKNI